MHRHIQRIKKAVAPQFYKLAKMLYAILKEEYKTLEPFKRIKRCLDAINRAILTLEECYSNIMHCANNIYKEYLYSLQEGINQIINKGCRYLAESPREAA